VLAHQIFTFSGHSSRSRISNWARSRASERVYCASNAVKQSPNEKGHTGRATLNIIAYRPMLT
jgi:hypothetical protein